MARNQDVARSPAACAHIQESAAVLLVCAFLGRSRLRGAGRPKASYERIARRARDLVLSRPKEPPTLVELCEHLHVGVRTLNYAFQSAVGNGVVLSRIASKWGFWHASDFARQYRALFGERPSETLHLNETPAALPGTRPRRAAPTPRTRTARRRTTKSA
jgi:AraC-like DNA-binding protein